MDLWVVKYASRRSRIGDFSGDNGSAVFHGCYDAPCQVQLGSYPA